MLERYGQHGMGYESKLSKRELGNRLNCMMMRILESKVSMSATFIIETIYSPTFLFLASTFSALYITQKILLYYSLRQCMPIETNKKIVNSTPLTRQNFAPVAI